MVFLNIALIVRWFCTLPRGQIDSSWFDHQRQWTLLMVLIKPEKYAGQNHVHIWCETLYIDGLVQERCNSIANALELRLSCTDPSTCTVKPLVQVAPNPNVKMFLVSSCSCLRSIHWSQVLSWEWRCSWGSADRRCSNYIWVINDFIAH